MKNASPTLTHEEIAANAYSLWEETGRPEGQDQELWLKAENQLRADRAQAETLRAEKTPTAASSPRRAKH